jgi:hypothetical protein
MQVTIQKKWASNRQFLIFYINNRSAAKRDKSFLVQQFFKATPHKDCCAGAQQDFSSDCIEISQAYFRMSRDFCAK